MFSTNGSGVVRGIVLTVVAACVASTASAQVPYGSIQVLTTVTQDPRTVWAGDLTGNGRTDIVACSLADNHVRWFHNLGGDPPTFDMYVIDSSAPGAREIYLDDVNRDGRLDVLVAQRQNDVVAWYENMGGDPPTFTKRVIDNTVGGAWSVFSIDLDQDGDIDVLTVGRDDNNVVWFENTGGSPPSWTKRVISTTAMRAQRVYVADVNGDGLLDVLSASGQDRKISWYQNLGGTPPTFTEHVITTSALNAKWVWTADMNGNGRQDVIAVSEGDSRVRIFYNNGDHPLVPTFTQQITSTVSGAKMALPFDVNGDGKLDLIACGIGINETLWLQNNGDHSFTPTFSKRLVSNVAQNPLTVFAADVTGDGDLDLMTASFLDNTIAWYRNRMVHRSARYPFEQLVDTTATGAFDVVVADVTRNGAPDFVSAARDANRVALHANDGGTPPSFTTHVVDGASLGAHGVAVGDINGDGISDIISGAFDSGQVAWHRNLNTNPPTFSKHAVGDAPGVRSVASGDVNGDGVLDILSASSNDNTIAWWSNNGEDPPAFTKHVIANNANQARSVFAIDLNRDGRVDALSASSGNNTIAWYENLGGDPPTWERRVIANNAVGARSVFAADMNGNGLIDVLSASFGDDTIAWYENLGGSPPTWMKHVVDNTSIRAFSVYAIDLDMDGDKDIVAASRDDNTIAWYENLGGDPPVFQKRVISADALGARVATVADVDRDGYLDVVAASADDATIAWHRNRGGQFALSTTDVAPAVIDPGDSSAVLAITVLHRGRAGDIDVEIKAIELLVEREPGTPLSTADADAFIESVTLYRDDGSGVFESGSDTLIAAVSPVALTDGVLQLAPTPGDPAAAVPYVDPGMVHVVFTMKDPPSPGANRQFRVVHITESSSSAVDAEFGFPLRAEYAPNAASSTVNFEVLVCPGDTNGDGVVDFTDFSTVLSQYGQTGPGLTGDLNGDEVVDFTDFSLVLANYGTDCNP